MIEFAKLSKKAKADLLTQFKFEQGLTYKQIGVLIGKSRGAVAGYCDRLGIHDADRKEDSMTTPVIPKAIADQLRAEPNSRHGLEPGRIRKRKLDGNTYNANHAVWQPISGNAIPVSIMDAGKHQCRWPIGDRTHTVCGVNAATGPYCEYHTSIAYNEDAHASRRKAREAV